MYEIKFGPVSQQGSLKDSILNGIRELASKRPVPVAQ
jgi:hypothetical protein